MIHNEWIETECNSVHKENCNVTNKCKSLKRVKKRTNKKKRKYFLLWNVKNTGSTKFKYDSKVLNQITRFWICIHYTVYMLSLRAINSLRFNHVKINNQDG